MSIERLAKRYPMAGGLVIFSVLLVSTFGVIMMTTSIVLQTISPELNHDQLGMTVLIVLCSLPAAVGGTLLMLIVGAELREEHERSKHDVASH